MVKKLWLGNERTLFYLMSTKISQTTFGKVFSWNKLRDTKNTLKKCCIRMGKSSSYQPRKQSPLFSKFLFHAHKVKRVNRIFLCCSSYLQASLKSVQVTSKLSQDHLSHQSHQWVSGCCCHWGIIQDSQGQMELAHIGELSQALWKNQKENT